MWSSVSLALALLIGAAELARMKPGAILLNGARANMVDNIIAFLEGKPRVNAAE